MIHNAVQDFYPDDLSHCYGCGRLNDRGMKLKTRWDGDETVTTYTPEKYHSALPGFVYGGLIASLFDCHGTGTAALAAYRMEGREPGSEPPVRFVTGTLHVEYLKPTPLGPALTVRGEVIEVKGRKVAVRATLSAEGVVCARGEIVAVRISEKQMAQ